jgi:hypothetical protein
MAPSGSDVAQQPVTHAGQTSSEAAAVRSRAEELSSRFGADAESTAGATPAAEGAAPTETASINTDANAAVPGPPVAVQVLAPAEDGVVSDVAASTNDAPVIEDMGTRPAKAAKRDTAAPSTRPAVQTAVRTAPVQALIKVNPAAPKADSDPMMPNELRAFGWSSQP